MVVVKRRKGMKGVLRVRMRVILRTSLGLDLRSSAVGGGENILRPIVEGSFTDPEEGSEPSQGYPDE